MGGLQLTTRRLSRETVNGAYGPTLEAKNTKVVPSHLNILAQIGINLQIKYTGQGMEASGEILTATQSQQPNFRRPRLF